MEAGSLRSEFDSQATDSPRQALVLQAAILDNINHGVLLPGVLGQIVHFVETLEPGSIVSILLLDRTTNSLRLGAAPNLPEKFRHALNGFSIGPEAGSCGSAVFHNKRVIVEDTRNDVRWRPYLSFVNEFSLFSCWTEPILDEHGVVAGAMALYRRHPHRPGPSEMATVQCAAFLAGQALSREAREPKAAFARVPSTDFFERICQVLPGAIVIFDIRSRSTVQVIGNPSASLGYSLEELTGRDPGLMFRLLHPDDVPRLDDHLMKLRALEGGETRSFVYRLRHADGTWRWFVNRDSVYLRNDQGEVEQIIGSVLDITEMKKSEVELRESEERLRHVLENTPACVFIKSLEGKYEYVNERTARALGRPASDVLGKTMDDLAPGSASDESRKVDRAVLETGKPIQGETRLPSRDGGMRDYMVVKFPLRVGGKIVALCGMANDVTELKRLQAKNELLLRSIDQSPDFVALSTPEGRGVYMNPAGRELVGLDDSFDISKLSIEDIVFPSEREEMFRQVQQVREKGEGQGETRFQNLRTGESIPIWWTAVSVSDPKTGLLIGIGTVCRDLSQMREIQDELRRRAEELARSNRDLEQFASMASHDLKEPLRMISSYLQLIERKHASQLEGSAKEYVSQAIGGARRMSSLIDALLSYSRVGGHELKREKVDCNGLLEEVRESLRVAIAETGAQIRVSELAQVQADRTLLAQVFQNLLSNAIKFRKKNEIPLIRVACEGRNGEWVFSVSDNGIGMSHEQARGAFDLFRRYHSPSEYPGEGIGLASSKRIIERHSGRIWVESEPAVGATFFFSLPREMVL